MPNYVIRAETGRINVGPMGCSSLARHFHKCHLDFNPPSKFPMVRYFHLCRAIEYALKSKLYETQKKIGVKKPQI